MGTGTSNNQDLVRGIAFKPEKTGQPEDTRPQLTRSQKLKPPDPPGRQTLLHKSTDLNKSSNKALHANLDFYRGKIKSDQGRGHSIDEMLEWRGNYKELEQNHSYIQWLFPIPESNGMNYFAQALQDHESEVIKNDKRLQAKVIAAFKMMLDFYGMELTTTTTDCAIQKCEGNWKERYENLNRSSHNFLRITRIIISLGEFGLERFQKPWVTFILFEAYVDKYLERLKGGSVSHWINAISDIEERQESTALHEELKSDNTQIETPEKKSNEN